jgi:hypothetical protein
MQYLNMSMVLRKKGQSALLRFEQIDLLIIRKRSISPDLESADWPFLRNTIDVSYGFQTQAS